MAGRDDIRHGSCAPPSNSNTVVTHTAWSIAAAGVGRQMPLRQARHSRTVDASTRKSP